jgi:hypothetical protein
MDRVRSTGRVSYSPDLPGQGSVSGLHAGLVRSPWGELFSQLISLARNELLLVSPFIKTQPINDLLSNLQQREVDRDITVLAVTNLRPESVLAGSTDVEALAALSRRLPRFKLIHLPSLHAKVYVADDQAAVVTSANLTPSGIAGNLEYGVAFTERRVVREIRRDFEGYSSLGAEVTAPEIEVIAQETIELRKAFIAAEKSIRRDAKRSFNRLLESANLRLLRQRARGKTTHAILADTILFFLARGPLRTIELHPLIQQLHPDICDDSVDRVIDGVHFGKRWKHYVRTAQAHLRRTGRIYTDGNRWYLAGGSH